MSESDDELTGADFPSADSGEGRRLSAQDEPPLYPVSSEHLVRRLYGKDLCRALEAHADLASWSLPGDEIWWWRLGNFLTLSGRAGYAIKRKGRIIASWVVIEN